MLLQEALHIDRSDLLLSLEEYLDVALHQTQLEGSPQSLYLCGGLSLAVIRSTGYDQTILDYRLEWIRLIPLIERLCRHHIVVSIDEYRGCLLAILLLCKDCRVSSRRQDLDAIHTDALEDLPPALGAAYHILLVG